jgi:hypothetical protein
VNIIESGGHGVSTFDLRWAKAVYERLNRGIHEVKVAGAGTLHPVRVRKIRTAPAGNFKEDSEGTSVKDHPIKGHSEGTSPQIAPTFLPNLGAPPR